MGPRKICRNVLRRNNIVHFKCTHIAVTCTNSLLIYSLLKVLHLATSSLHGPVQTEKFENGGLTLKTHQMFSVHITSEEFENGGFTLKTHQMSSVHTTSEEFKDETCTITGHFRVVFEENSDR